jgi:hypothetical protein
MLHPPKHWGRGVTAVLYAYVDPSGTHIGSPVVSISGFLANEDTWLAFDKAWWSVLHKPSWPSHLTRFHMVDCVHCEAEFLKGGWPFAERLALYGELVEVIRTAGIRPISASVVDCFNQLPPEDLALLKDEKNKLGTPLDLVFHMITQQIIKRAREWDSSETVGILFDQDDTARETYFAEFVQQYKHSYHLSDTFSAYGFGDSRQVSPLQAADLLAYGTHHLIQQREAVSTYSVTEFPVVRAFWNMLVDLALNPLTSPDGQAINLSGLKDLVQKVKNKELLPKRAGISV